MLFRSVAPYYIVEVPAGEECVLRCRLMAQDEIVTDPFAERNFGAIMQKRLKEANEFYKVAIPCKCIGSCFVLQFKRVLKVMSSFH